MATGGKTVIGMAGGIAIGAGLAALVVMCKRTPRNPKEWSIGLTSTVIGSACGGPALIQYFGLQAWAHDYFGLMALVGIVFACGLPAWAIVRWTFNFIDKRENAGIDEVVQDVKKGLQ